MKKLFVVFLLLSATDELNIQSSFYQGKTIRIIVGYLAGDNHDLWARAYGRFMGRHIPGNPDFVVQDMPGAGSMIAANHVYNLTKPDGLTLGAIGRALYYAQLTGRGEVKFDWAKFTWIGTGDHNGTLVSPRGDRLVEEAFGEVTVDFCLAGGQNEKARVSHLSSPSL